MDDQHRATLALIESAVDGLSVADRGRQLLHVACDYADDGNVLYARTVLRKIEESYFTEHLPRQAAAEAGVAQALAALVAIFGHDLVMVLRSAAES